MYVISRTKIAAQQKTDIPRFGCHDLKHSINHYTRLFVPRATAREDREILSAVRIRIAFDLFGPDIGVATTIFFFTSCPSGKKILLYTLIPRLTLIRFNAVFSVPPDFFCFAYRKQTPLNCIWKLVSFIERPICSSLSRKHK